MIPPERLLQWASLHAQPLARACWELLGVLARRLPGPVMAGFARSLGGPDRVLADEPRVREALLLSLLEGLRQGGAATVEDYAIEGRAWGFDPAASRFPCCSGTASATRRCRSRMRAGSPPAFPTRS